MMHFQQILKDDPKFTESASKRTVISLHPGAFHNLTFPLGILWQKLSTTVTDLTPFLSKVSSPILSWSVQSRAECSCCSNMSSL